VRGGMMGEEYENEARVVLGGDSKCLCFGGRERLTASGLCGACGVGTCLVAMDTRLVVMQGETVEMDWPWVVMADAMGWAHQVCKRGPGFRVSAHEHIGWAHLVWKRERAGEGGSVQQGKGRPGRKRWGDMDRQREWRGNGGVVCVEVVCGWLCWRWLPACISWPSACRLSVLAFAHFDRRVCPTFTHLQQPLLHLIYFTHSSLSAPLHPSLSSCVCVYALARVCACVCLVCVRVCDARTHTCTYAHWGQAAVSVSKGAQRLVSDVSLATRLKPCLP